MTLRTIAALGLLSIPLLAQRLPTTIDQLADRAALIVRARVLGLSTTSDGMLQAGFLTTESLLGAPPRTFVLTEHDGERCARSLGGLVPGLGVVLFLERTSGTTLALVDGDPNAVWTNEPALLERLRALLGPVDPARVIRTCLDALMHGSPNLRLDAANTLATSPRVRALGAEDRERFRIALPAVLAELPSLLEPLGRAVERLGDSAIDVAFARATTTSTDAAPILRRLLARRTGPDREILSNALRGEDLGELGFTRPRGDASFGLPRFRAIRPLRR